MTLTAQPPRTGSKPRWQTGHRPHPVLSQRPTARPDTELTILTPADSTIVHDPDAPEPMLENLRRDLRRGLTSIPGQPEPDPRQIMAAAEHLLRQLSPQVHALLMTVGTGDEEQGHNGTACAIRAHELLEAHPQIEWLAEAPAWAHSLFRGIAEDSFAADLASRLTKAKKPTPPRHLIVIVPTTTALRLLHVSTKPDGWDEDITGGTQPLTWPAPKRLGLKPAVPLHFRLKWPAHHEAATFTLILK